MNIPNDLSQKMSAYDDRVVHNQQLVLIKQGIPFGIPKPDSPLRCLVVNPNWRGIREGKIDPPPVLLVFEMDAFHGIMSLHADEVVALFNRRVHVEDFFVFISALFKPLVEKAMNNDRFAGQGYSFVEIRHLTDYIASWAPQIYADCFNQGIFPDGTAFVWESLRGEYWKEVVPHMLKFISHSRSTKNSTDWLLFRPTRFAYICDDETVFLHLGTVLHFFMSMLEHFEKTGEFGEVKGKLMENLLIQVIEQVDGFERIWEPRHKIDYPVSGRAKTDVDVFVRRSELAFLISCKSYGVNREYELGNGQTCWDRSEDAKGLLKFAHQTAKVIAAHHEELGLSNSIRGIIPFGCTGWPEYIFEPSHDYYMTDGTPRVATVKEMEELFKKLDDNKCSALLADPWFVPITVPG